MPSLLTLNEVSIGFRGPLLLDSVSCRIESGERIGLLGRNGMGKTTLMKMLVGQIEPDHGTIVPAPDIRIALLQQEVPRDWSARLFDVVRQGLPENNSSDHHDAWKADHEVDQILSRMSLDPDARFETQSSGMKRRVLLAKALVSQPQVLLLDEPTNHLDIDAIQWMEEFLARWRGTLMFVTHDRMFLRRMATRILEIDRGQLFDWSCDYETFLSRKEAALEAEEKQNALFDKRLAEEERWIRQGIKARRTRNEGRVRALEKLRRERAERREKTGKANLQIEQGRRSGTVVADLDDVSFGYDEESPVISKFSCRIERGDRVGLIGPNGVGKSTLIKLLLGKIEPQSGQVRQGTNLEIAYFDQLRETLDDEQTVQENIGGGSDTIKIGDRSKHVLGYLQDFLFSPERARTPIKFLSGGERNRILLARLFAKPANVIVMDEPTNDLDTETLELLEERLVEYQGTLLIVSHDREFLNHVVTSTLSFEDGTVKEYDGGYDDWKRQRDRELETRAEAQQATEAKAKKKSSNGAGTSTSSQSSDSGESVKRKLSYKEKRELEELPSKIETLETDIGELHDKMGQPEFYQQAGDLIAEATAHLTSLEESLAAAYERWEELETHSG